MSMSEDYDCIHEDIDDKIEYCNVELLNQLEPYGAIDWHESKYNSRYIKFKDTRLGSIRIADHRGRSKYHYTYEIFIDQIDNLDAIINLIVQKVIKKSKSISNFDPKKFIVYKDGSYVELKNIKEFKSYILTKGK